jgi:hypothetical protein
MSAVTSLDDAADAVLADMTVDRMRPVAYAAARILDNGNGSDIAEIAALTGSLSVRELRALALLALDCADMGKIREACGPRCGNCGKGLRPRGTSAPVPGSLCQACRRAGAPPAEADLDEYAWLRGGGVVPAEAAWRACGISAPEAAAAVEAAWRERRGAAA